MTLADGIRGEILYELAQRGEGDRAMARVWGITPGLAAAKLDGRADITTDEVERAATWFGLDPFDLVRRARHFGAE